MVKRADKAGTAKRMGRPPKPPGEVMVDVTLRVPPALLARVDAMVDRETGEDRSTVLRRLIVRGME